MKKCIAFDVDRTIIDSYMPELLSLQDAIELVTGKKLDEKKLEKMTTLTTDEFFLSLDFSNEEVMLIREKWHITYNNYEIKCFPKIKEIIRELFNRGYIIAIITSRTMKEVHELDDELREILGCFKVIVCSDIIKNPKPDREGMDYLCNQLQLRPEDIIYIGDRKIDSAFSKICNVDFIPACWENKELEKEEMACNKPEMMFLRIDEYNNSKRLMC